MKRAAPIFVILAGILWGTMGTLVRNLNACGLNSLDIVLIRAQGSTLLLFLYLIIFNRAAFKIKLKDLWVFLGTGIASIVFFNACYFYALEQMTMATACVLLYTAPAFVIILSAILFHEKVTKKKFICLIMVFAGCVFVTGMIGGENKLTLIGFLAGLGSGLGYALYSIFGRYAIEKGYSSITITFYTFLIAGLSTMIFANPFTCWTRAFSTTTTTGISAVMMALACTIAPFMLYTIGLQYIENGVASMMATIEPVTSAICGIIFFHEKITLEILIGMILVFSGIIICNISFGGKKQITAGK